MRKMTLAVATMLAAAGGWATVAHAQNLVQNPGFEADDTSLGPVSPPASWAATDNAGVDSSSPNTGNNDGYMGPGTLSQALTTSIGTVYTIDFFLKPDSGTFSFADATMNVSFDGQDLLGGTPITAADPGFTSGDYTEFTYTATATSNNATLLFTGFTSGTEGNWLLDDVSVTGPATTEIPEPPSALILASVLGMLTLMRLRRKA